MRGVTANHGAPPQQMRETVAAPGPSKSSSKLELNFGNDIMQEVRDDIMQEVEGYTKTGMVMINIQSQDTRGDPSSAMNLVYTRSYIGAGASTSGAQALTGGTGYVCRDWVS